MKASALTLMCGVVSLGTAGCLPPPPVAAPLTSTFAVSDYYTPSGYMGDGARLGNLSVEVNQNCKPRPEGHQGDCYVFTYRKDKVQTDHWAGVYWVFPANNWGSNFGHAIDSTKFHQIRYQVAIEGPSPFTVGGVPQFFNGFAGRITAGGGYTNLGNPMTQTNPELIGLQDHSDAVSASPDSPPTIGTDIVGTELRPFSIPLTSDDISANCQTNPALPQNCDANGFANDLIGAFGWSFHYPDDADPNGTQSVKVYLDDIVWDTSTP
jgi:hypothetical protein